MRKHKTVIFLTLGLLIGVCFLLYPSFSNFWNSKTQSRAITDYESVLGNLSAEEYEALWKEAEEYNKALYETEYPLMDHTTLSGYDEALSVEGARFKADLLSTERRVRHDRGRNSRPL